MTDQSSSDDTKNRSGSIYEYTVWELGEIGERAIFVVDGRDFEDDDAAHNYTRSAIKKCREMGIKIFQTESHRIMSSVDPRSPLPTWEEFLGTRS